jgi:Uma2 family endonuclease
MSKFRQKTKNNMNVIEKLPLTIQERLEMDEIISQYKAEYHNGEIISMGFASEIHELLVANIIRCLGNIFLETNCRVYSSNLLVYVPECEAGYNPDTSIICGETLSTTYQRNIKATLNPSLIVEVLSPTTRNFDLGEKLQCYKTIPSLQQIIFIEQHKVWVSSYQRMNQTGQWLNTDIEDMIATLDILEKKLKISDIYQHISFEKKNI